MISIDAYRAAIGRYYSKAKFLSSLCHDNINVCSCQKYQDYVYRLSKYNLSTMHKFLYEEYTNYFETREFSEKQKDLEFCITTLEVADNVSFLKLLKLIVDGDVEVNPGPTHNTGTPKGRKMKNKSFNFTPEKLDMDNIDNNNIRTVMNFNRNGPVGLINHANECFF